MKRSKVKEDSDMHEITLSIISRACYILVNSVIVEGKGCFICNYNYQCPVAVICDRYLLITTIQHTLTHTHIYVYIYII